MAVMRCDATRRDRMRQRDANSPRQLQNKAALSLHLRIESVHCLNIELREALFWLLMATEAGQRDRIKPTETVARQRDSAMFN